MIKDYYNKEVTIKRNEYQDDGKTDISTIDTFNAHIQEADEEEVERIGMRFTEGYKMWCDLDKDVKKGDQVHTTNHKYKVGGIIERDYGNNQHLEVFMEQVDE